MLSIPERPAPEPEVPEVPEVEKLLQQLVRKTRPTKAMNPTVTTPLEKMLFSFLDRQRRQQRPPPKQRPFRRDWLDVMCFSCGKMGHSATRCPDFKRRRGFHCDTSAGDNGPPTGGKRRLIREGGGGGLPLGSGIMFGPGERYRLFPHNG